MTIALNRTMTLEEYLAYDDGTDKPCELVEGVLIKMGAERDLNNRIALFLLMVFSRFVPLNQLRNKTEVETPSRLATSRYPDFVVLTSQGSAAISDASRSMVRLTMPTPALVGEVVSPGKEGSENHNRDYIEKRREYAARGIPEYWIIDPDRQVVLILVLVGKTYQEQQFTGEATIVSPTFPELQLTATQVLNAGQ